MSPGAGDNDTCSSHTQLQVLPWHNQSDSVPAGHSHSQQPAGKLGVLLCFLQPPHFWDDPCFSANRGLANLISGKVSRVQQCAWERRVKNLLQ